MTQDDPVGVALPILQDDGVDDAPDQSGLVEQVDLGAAMVPDLRVEGSQDAIHQAGLTKQMVEVETPSRADQAVRHACGVANQADTTDQYNMLSQNLGGDEKSSAFYAFSSIWLNRNADGYGEEAGGYGKEAGTEEIQAEATRWIGLVGVTQFAKAESLTAIYLTHATVEQ